jgi:hypothetical protein
VGWRDRSSHRRILISLKLRPPATNSGMDHQDSSIPIPIASSSNGRLSRKSWKHKKTATACVLLSRVRVS